LITLSAGWAHLLTAPGHALALPSLSPHSNFLATEGLSSSSSRPVASKRRKHVCKSIGEARCVKSREPCPGKGVFKKSVKIKPDGFRFIPADHTAREKKRERPMGRRSAV